MYLSRVEIDDRNRFKIKDLSHLGAYHSWVEQSFPKDIEEKKRPRHLWRIDKLGLHRYLLIVSAEKPNLLKLEKYGVKGSAATKDYDSFLEKITNQSIWNFRLTANPSYRINKNGKTSVVPHITVSQQMNWLIKRASKYGFEFFIKENIAPEFETEKCSFDIVNRNWPILWKKGKSGKAHSIKLSQVTFEGVLKVTDVELFKKALISGIGREKAYGMGMLTVIPFRGQK